MSHPSERATKKTIAQRFVWPGMQKDIANWAKTCLCLPCQRAKIHRHNHRIPEQIDIVGPLPSAEGLRYCLTMIDRTTRRPEATPIADISADTVVNAFFNMWVARFGAPSVITTDRGAQFESAIFEAMTKLIRSRRIWTTAYHLQSNGMIER